MTVNWKGWQDSMKTAAEGASTCLYLAFNDIDQNSQGKFWSDMYIDKTRAYNCERMSMQVIPWLE